MHALKQIDTWNAPSAVGAVVRSDGTVLGAHGPVDKVFYVASVTKLLSAYATLIAIEEGALTLDEPAGPSGATVAHLLAHASGLGFDGTKPVARPATKRIYSNPGYDVLAEHVAKRTGIPFGDYLREAILEPLDMADTWLGESAAKDLHSSAADLIRFSTEVMAPRLLAPETVAEATRVQFPGLDGVLPGFGLQRPLDWGYGFEIRDHKSPHWTGSRNSPRTFGHFGATGTFLWVDPAAGVSTVVLTDRRFNDWAAKAWPVLSDGVLAEVEDQTD